VEYTYEVEEEVSDWKVKEQDLRWSQLAIGGIKVDPGRCEVQLDWQQIYHNEYTESPTGDKYRETVGVIATSPTCSRRGVPGGHRRTGLLHPDFPHQERIGGLPEPQETNRLLLLALSVVR
jgi:hypothetical protein